MGYFLNLQREKKMNKENQQEQIGGDQREGNNRLITWDNIRGE